MSSGNWILTALLPLVVGVVLGIMIAWELGVSGACFVGAMPCLIEASHKGTWWGWLWLGIILLVVTALLGYDSFRRVQLRDKLKQAQDEFKKRLAGYTTEGQQLLYGALSTYTIKGYMNAMQAWTDKVGDDIGTYAGAANRKLFMDHINMKATLEQMRQNPEAGQITAIIGMRLTELEHLQKRL